MSKPKLSGSINLQKLVHVKTQMKGKDGTMKDVLIIPIAENGLYVGEKSINLNFDIVQHDGPDQYGNDGFIAKRTPYKLLFGKDTEWKDLTEDQKNKVNSLSPILGNFKELDFSGGSSNNSETLDTSFEPQVDDLPF